MTTTTAPPAERVLAFANTVDVEAGTDTLTTPESLTAWLREQGLLGSAAPAAGPDELLLARELRSGLRAQLAEHHGAARAGTEEGDRGRAPGMVPAGEGDAAALDRAAARLPLRLSATAAGPKLAPASDGVAGALAEVLVAVAATGADRTWSRLKLCPAGDCRWAFLDASKNRSRTWCSMGVCGNRSKTRAYRSRHRATGDPAPGSG